MPKALPGGWQPLVGQGRVIDRLIRTRSREIIVLFAVAALVCAVAAGGVRIDTSVEHLMIRDDPDRALNHRMKEEFSNDELIIVGFDVGHPFTADDVRRLASISQQIATVPGVEEVIDLSNVEDVRQRGTDTLDASALVDLDTLDRDIERIRARVRDHRLYRSSLVSPRLDVLALVVVLRPDLSEAQTQQVAGAVVERVVELAAPWPAYPAGYPVTSLEANRIVRRDYGVLTAAALAVIGVMIFVIYQRWSVVALTATLVAWTEIVALAWMAASDTPLGVMTSSLPTILVATSSAYAIYTFGMLRELSHRPQPASALAAVLSRPVLLSGGSTAVGFLSLRFIEVQAIGELGTALAVGIAAATSGTLLLLPALVRQLSLHLAPAHEAPARAGCPLGIRLARRPWLTTAVFLLGVAASVPGLARIVVNTDVDQYFARDHPVRVNSDFLSKHLSGPYTVNVVVSTPVESGALEPDVLAFASRLVDEAERDPATARTNSFLDYIYLMDAALRPGEPARTVLSSRAEAAQYMLLYELGGDPGDYRHFINHQRSALNLYIRSDAGSRELGALAVRLRAFAASAPATVEVHLLGSFYLFAKAMIPIALGVTEGLLMALMVIVVMIAVMLRSVKLALVAAIPNAIPILVAGGMLGWLEIPLSMGTSIVGCVVLGLAVDDTAHVMGHLRAGTSLDAIYRTVGRTLVATSIVLSLGFATLMLSGFETVFELGAAIPLTLALALACDLLLLPSLLVLAGYPLHAAEPAA